MDIFDWTFVARALEYDIPRDEVFVAIQEQPWEDHGISLAARIEYPRLAIVPRENLTERSQAIPVL